MTKKERIIKAIEFRKPDRVPFASVVPGISDVFFMIHAQARDWQPDEGYYPHVYPIGYYINSWRYRKPVPPDLLSPKYKRQDEFGCAWKTEIEKSIGQVIGHPLKSRDDLDTFKFPDPYAPGRLDRFDLYRRLLSGDSFVLGSLENGLWERSHFLRGFQELLMATASEPDEVGRLLDRLLDEWFIPLTGLYASRGAHGVIMADDWGTQTGLMIRPDSWRELFKPRYARLFEAAHERGMKFFMHSCGHIADIIPDLVEIGLDVLQKDDMEFMGMEELAELAAGKICFMGSLDIQRTMPGADDMKLVRETRRMLRLFAKGDGGFIGTYYGQPEAAGVTWRQMLVMRAAFLRYGRYPIR